MKPTIGIPLRSLLIWLTTNAGGALLLLLYLLLTGSGEIGITGLVLIFGLLFSAPVIALLIPSLYILRNITSKEGRLVFSIFLIPVLCAAIIGLTSVIFGNLLFMNGEMMMIFVPYIIAAEVIYFLFTWNMIAGNDPSPKEDTTPLDTPYL